MDGVTGVRSLSMGREYRLEVADPEMLPRLVKLLRLLNCDEMINRPLNDRGFQRRAASHLHLEPNKLSTGAGCRPRPRAAAPRSPATGYGPSLSAGRCWIPRPVDADVQADDRTGRVAESGNGRASPGAVTPGATGPQPVTPLWGPINPCVFKSRRPPDHYQTTITD